MRQTREYQVISEFYGNRVAFRSNVPLINHINEGLVILENIRAPELVKDAFCIHPIVQTKQPIDVSWSESYSLACEYSRVANSYLCKPETDHVQTVDDVFKLVGKMSKECRDMLLADKLQNRKDFLIHHQDHPRFDQLNNYFDLWLRFLQSNHFSYHHL